MVSILARTLIVYLLLTFSLRVMGKRQIGELEVSELISTFLISEIAAIPIDDNDIPLMNAIIPILFLFSIEIIVAFIKNKKEKIKRIVEGTPTYIIYKGKLLESALKNNRLSINELMREMRQQGFCSIGEIYYGILEQNGKLSLYDYQNGPKLAHSVIIDGEVDEAKLRALGYDRKWLDRRLKKDNLQREEVLLFCVNDNGEVEISKKERKE